MCGAGIGKNEHIFGISARAFKSKFRRHLAKRWVMKVCISEFPDDSARQAAAWEGLAGHVATTQASACRAARDAVRRDRMIDQLGELGALGCELAPGRLRRSAI
jgi:hypothetical protein